MIRAEEVREVSHKALDKQKVERSVYLDRFSKNFYKKYKRDLKIFEKNIKKKAKEGYTSLYFEKTRMGQLEAEGYCKEIEKFFQDNGYIVNVKNELRRSKFNKAFFTVMINIDWEDWNHLNSEIKEVNDE